MVCIGIAILAILLTANFCQLIVNLNKHVNAILTDLH